MRKREFEDAVSALAAEAGLRKIARGHRPGQVWIGIHRGIFVKLHLDTVPLEAEFSSPEPAVESTSASEPEVTPKEQAVAGEVERKPATEAFRRVSEIGVDADWFDQKQSGGWGFCLVIDQPRWADLRQEKFAGLLDCVAADLNELGAEESKPCCQCAAPATTLAYIESLGEEPLLAPYCATCWNELQKSTRGTVKKAPPRQRLLAWLALALGVVVMGLVWGYAQHPEFRVPMHFLILGCCAAGVGLAATTMAIAQGSDVLLRLGVVAGVLLATVMGNVMGVKMLIEANQGQVSWAQVVPFYFLKYLPMHIGQEILFFVGGVAGVAIGFYIMRESERMRIR